jgi:phospholipid/cholesterol/gamma-HCH transport system ATP-binding protein
MIEAKDVWKSYKGTTVLKGLSLSVPEGKKVIILGRSGVGKSVLLRQINGLEKPDSGEISVDGVCISSLGKTELYKRRKHFGMLFQNSALFDSMTVGENVGFYLTEHETRPFSQEIEDRVALALKKVGLEGFETKMPSELSGGQRKRAALARLLIYGPKIMLCDEPTTGLDPITTMQINELIRDTHKELGATTVIVTHDIHSALFLGDIFALHHEGRIAWVGNKEQFTLGAHPLLDEFLHYVLPERKK